MTSKNLYLLLFCCLILQFAEAQNLAPGGVKGASIWYAATLETAVWKSQLPHSENWPQWPITAGVLLNFNPGLNIDTQSPNYTLPLKDLALQQASFFTVYQPADAIGEKSIWHLRAMDSTRLVLTTQRLADLQQWQYLNFKDQPSAVASLNTYLLHSQDKKQAINQDLLLGSVPQDQALPLVPFRGLLPELLIFDRVLNPEERLRVESYLALKYGLSLQQPEYITYLSSTGDTLWYGHKQMDFSSRITGIGRDDVSGLQQYQSTSSDESGLLTIAMEMPTTDQTFLLWGDNSEPLALAPKEILQPAHLQRQWRMQATNTSESLNTILSLDGKRLQEIPTAEETYWLIIDHSNEGHFKGANQDFYPATAVSPSGLVSFTEVNWANGIQTFSFGIGPKMMVTSQINAPICQSGEQGQLSLRILGGRAPYHCHLQSEDRTFNRHWQTDDQHWQQPIDLPEGSYQLMVEDADGHRYQEAFFMQAADAPVSTLAQSYTLPIQGPLILNASIPTDQTDLNYHWIAPSGQESHQAQIEIEEPGIYRLIIDHQGCRSQQDILIKDRENDPFLRVELFPNPSPDGHFQFRVLLQQNTDLKLNIYDSNGRLIAQQEGSGSDYYLFTGKLEQAGIYLLSLTCGEQTISRKLMVE